MWRTVLAVIGGLVTWTVVVTLIDIGLRLVLPGYRAAEPALTFTFAMKIARLAMAAVTSLAAGVVMGRIAPANSWAPWVVGLAIVALFLPEHIHIWARFPIWYHLLFLIPLAPLIALGAGIERRRRDRMAGRLQRKLSA
jgi:hypothetical protein